MKVLYLLDQWPVPATTGAKVHDKIMMDCLTTDWQAEVAYWSGTEESEGSSDALSKNVFSRTILSWRSFPGVLLRLLFQREPLHTVEFLSADARRKLRELIASASPEIIVLSCPRLAVIVPFIKTVSRSKIIVDTHDVHVQRCKSIYQATPARNVLERLKQRLLISSYGIIEKEVYKQVDVAWVLKKEDKILLESFHSVPRVDIVPNVVDPAMLRDVEARAGDSRKRAVSCVFIGDYSYKPNAQCAFALMDWFSSANIKATGVKLHLIGVNPTISMKRRAEDIENVDVTGEVADLGEYLHAVDTIFLTPLLAGGGVKRKVIEAMAFGCPVITTSVGAEGLDLVDGEMAEICPVDSFPDTIVRLVGDRERRIRLAKRGQEHINANFGYEKLRISVKSSLQGLVAEPKPRSQEFWGSSTTSARRVTVMMAVFNERDYLDDAVQSVLNQTLEDFVFMIIDDGSTDGSEDYLDELTDPRVQVFHQPHKGRGEAQNFGLQNCRTEFLAKMDADDVILPNKLQAQFNFLQENDDVGVVGTQFRYFGEGGLSPIRQRLPLDHKTIYCDLRNGKLSLVHASLMGRMDVFSRAGAYRITELGLDWDMMLRLAEVAKIANLDQEYYHWRLHIGNTGFQRLRGGRERVGWACCCADLRSKGKPEIPLDDFIEERRSLSWIFRTFHNLDAYVLFQYRKATREIVNNRKRIGYPRLAFAAVCAPRRSLGRVRKMWRGVRPEGNGLAL